MELLNPTEVFLLKAALWTSIAYGAQRVLSYVTQKPHDPLIPGNRSSQSRSKTTITPTRGIKKGLVQNGKQCIYFYGSQTGTAEKLASILAKEAKNRFGIEGIIADLDDYDYGDLPSLPEHYVVVFLLATYGEGEPTDNAIAFERYRANLPSTVDATSGTLHYASFGLGNSSYQFYNGMIKRVDSTLSSIGASRIGAVGLGDDGKGTLEDDFLAWKDKMLPLLAKHLGLVEQKRKHVTDLKVVDLHPSSDVPIFTGEPSVAHRKGKLRGPWTASNPYPARIVKSRQLFNTDSRKCLHVEFNVMDSTVTYETGDHLGVWPENCNLEVERFLQVFGQSQKKHHSFQIECRDPTIKVSIPTHTTYDAAARYYLDICAPVSRHFLTALIDFASDNAVKTKLLQLSTDSIAFDAEVKRPHLNISQLLEHLGSTDQWASVPAPLLFENIRKLQPRYYSISSSSIQSKKQISITAVVESRKQPEWSHEFKGVATNFLLAQHENFHCQAAGIVKISKSSTHHLGGPRYRGPGIISLIHVRRSNFRLPRSTSTPIIMIGPGTGVAPFRAFVQERAVRNESQPAGRTMLFYGCRTRNEDFLYEDEWKEYEKSFQPGTFTIDVAFSREDPEQKIYVQNLLQERAAELRKLILEENACVYVCGDARRMAKDVFKTMTQIIAGDAQFNGSLRGAETHLKGLKKCSRWFEDVW